MRQNWVRLARIGVVAVALFVAGRVSGSEPLPPVDDVLRQLVERSQKQPTPVQPVSYVCTKKTVTEELDSSGHVTTRKVKVGQSRTDQGAKDANKWGSQNGISLDDQLLQRFQFTLVKRELFNGRSTLVLTFVPKQPALPIHHFQDRLLNRAMGTLWVDEQDHELAKATIGLAEPVSFGILGAVEKLSFGFERAHTDSGLWLTRWTDTDFKGRKFIIPVQIRKRVDCSDFTRLAAEQPEP